MLPPIQEKILIESLSPAEYFKSYQNDKDKEAEASYQAKSDSIEISDAGRDAFNSSLLNQSTSHINNSINRAEETKSYTMKSAKTTFSKSTEIDLSKASLVATSTLKSGATVNIYTDDYAKGEEKIPGTSKKIMAEITQKDGSTEVITLTENTVISEDANGRTIIKEVPRKTQDAGANLNGTKSAQYSPTNLQGTDGDDIIINIFEGTNSINTGKGDDTVISFHSVNNIDLGVGNNKLQVLGGSYQSITAGNGANTIESKSRSSILESISLGNGDNKVDASTIRNMLVGDGNNNIDVQNLLAGITVGDGDSKLNIQTMHENSQLNLGLGSNDVDLEAMQKNSAINNTAGDQNISVLMMRDANINLKEGNHKVNVTDSNNSAIHSGEGDSAFTIESMNNSALDVGEGSNAFHIGVLYESTINVKKEEGITKATKPTEKLEQDEQTKESAQGGNNKFYIGLMEKSEINTGNGDTNFYVESMDESNINTGEGDDTFYFDEVGGGTIKTGNGDNKIHVKGSIWGHQNSDPLNLDMGDGNNKLHVQGHAHKLNFTSGNGNDSVKIDSFISDSNINTGYGTDEVKRNINSFVHNSNIRYGFTEEEQIKTHEVSRTRENTIYGDINFAKTNPEYQKILDETLPKSPFYEAPFSLHTGHTKKEAPFYDTAFKA